MGDGPHMSVDALAEMLRVQAEEIETGLQRARERRRTAARPAVRTASPGGPLETANQPPLPPPVPPAIDSWMAAPDLSARGLSSYSSAGLQPPPPPPLPER